VARSFFDTNVLFYSFDTTDPNKHKRAKSLITDLLASGNAVISIQVIQELANNLTKKLGFSNEFVVGICDSLEEFMVVKPDVAMVRRVLNIQTTASVAFWDACIVASAERAGCVTLYSEELNSGQRIGAIKVVNPFA